jgi:hypothetical protein
MRIPTGAHGDLVWQAHGPEEIPAGT